MSTAQHATRSPAAVRPDDVFTYAEAAEVTGLSADTIERDRKKGRYPNAYQDRSPRRAWLVTATDLVAAGRLDPDLVEQAQAALAAVRESKTVRELREQVVRLEEQLLAATERCHALAEDKSHQQKLLEALVRKGA